MNSLKKNLFWQLSVCASAYFEHLKTEIVEKSEKKLSKCAWLTVQILNVISDSWPVKIDNFFAKWYNVTSDL